MATIERYSFLFRMDDEEEGDAYYEYHALTEDDKVIPGTRWTHVSSNADALYLDWLVGRGHSVIGSPERVVK